MQILPSSQASFEPVHLPSEHTSSFVHLSPSSQFSLLALVVQPLSLSHMSVVQGFLSSHVIDAPPQVPSLQTSFVVQASPSSQKAVLFLCVQPVSLAQRSVVQASPSSHATEPPTHLPSLQRSLSVHLSPSSQSVGVTFAAKSQAPVLPSHLSVVQGLLSVQVLASPAVHRPALQMSLSVHLSPSSQSAELSRFTQPLALSQLSSVQGLLSSQANAVPRHLPFAQASFSVHASPSLHGDSIGVALQPFLPSQASLVHGSPSSHVSSSIWPSQSSSSPSQSSFVGATALQTLNPAAEHARVPGHCPTTCPVGSSA